MLNLQSAAALLDFLRNLTPQILLLSVAFVLGAKLDLGRLELSWQGLGNAWPFWSVIAVLFIAFFANMFVFLERMLETSEATEIEFTRAMRREGNFMKRLLSLFQVLWKFDKLYLLRTLLAFGVIMSGAVVLLISGTAAAVQLLRASGAA